MTMNETGLIDEVAQLMAEASATIIKPLYQNLTPDDIATKSSDTDFVTVADREAEFWLMPRLEALLPEAIALGEESISDDPVAEKQLRHKLAFVIDPIDGTRNFVNGTPHFCSMISLIDKGEPLISWILRPVDDDIFVAVADEGVFHSDLEEGEWQLVPPAARRSQLNDMIGTGGIKGLSGHVRDEVRQQLRALPGRRLIGSAGCEAIMLATGAHDFLMHAKTTAWDHTPVDLFAREAGLVSAHMPSGEGYSPFNAEALLVAPDEAAWHQLANHIWTDPVNPL